MILTKEQQDMLDGRSGRVKQLAMDLLVRYGEAVGAERMIKVDNCGIGTLPVLSAEQCKARGIEPGDYEQYYLRGMFGWDQEGLSLDHFGASQVTNLCANTVSNIRHLGAGEEAVRFMQIVDDFIGSRGCVNSNTCAPFLNGVIPAFGEHCAWSESSAITYLNGVLGARTNNEGGASSACAAITGYTPYFGLHTDEARWGTHLIHIQKQPKDPFEWGALGYYAASVVNRGVPVFLGVHNIPSNDDLRYLATSLATSGEVDMFHVVGVTPEAHTLEQAMGKNQVAGEFTFGEKEFQAVMERLNFSKQKKVDIVIFGCPHCSIQQIKEIAEYVSGKQYRTRLTVLCSPSTKNIADRSGYTKKIEEAGGFVGEGACPLLNASMTPEERVIATNSEKFAHYVTGMPGYSDKEVHLGSMEQCLNAALCGEWA